MKAIVTVGISASGKSTWAREQKGFRIIERDRIREELYWKRKNEPFSWKKWNWKWENDVTDFQKMAFETAAFYKENIIVSDTNLNDGRRASMIRELKALGFEVEVKVFPIEFKEAVKRDKARDASVGIDVIAKQLDQFNEGEFGPKKHVHQANLPCVYLCDIDGTVAEMDGRGPFEWDKVKTDKPRESVCWTIRALISSGAKVIFFSGRDGVCRHDTIDWIGSHVQFDGHIHLHMRTPGDMRPDHVVKEEMFQEHIDGKFNVIAVFDDRPQVVRKWRSMGIEVFQIGNQLVEF